MHIDIQEYLRAPTYFTRPTFGSILLSSYIENLQNMNRNTVSQFLHRNKISPFQLG